MPADNKNQRPDTKINWQLLKIVWPWLLDFKARVALALSCLVLAKLANVAGPWLLKLIVDDLDAAGNTALLALPIALILTYGFARFGNVILGEIRDTLFGRVTEHAMRRIGLQVFEHLHSLDLDFHLNRRTGGLARDIERGTTGISFLMRFYIFNIIPTLLEVLLIAGILLLNYGPGFALIIIVSVVFFVGFSIIATDWRTRFVREVNAADSETNTRAIDSLLNYETVKYFTNEEYEARHYDQSLHKWQRARRKNRLSLLTLNGGQALIIAAATTAMVWLAASQVRDSQMTLGDFVAVNSYMLILFLPLNFLGFVYREIKGSLANIEKMFELLNVAPKVADRPNAKELKLKSSRIVFDQVDFHYQPDRPILRKVSFVIEPGQKVAVVGASGAGKSTLVKLLFRFYDVTAGSVAIDDQNIQSLSQQSLRATIGIVPQDTVLFNDSIFENIRYGNTEASDQQVWQAIKQAQLGDFIQQLPQGEQTLVGERGLKLSGGEKQRVAIARALLKQPPIMVFDEATSSLDSRSEQAILQAINAISQHHTSLVIAHRLSTIVDADRIVVLHQGQVVEQGNHAQLLAKKGHYAELWHTQQKNRPLPLM